MPNPPFNPSKMYKGLVAAGMDPSTAKATVDEHIQRAEMGMGDHPEDTDPGMGASLAEGAASGMSLGLGPLIARGLEGSEAADFQREVKKQHPGALMIGETAGSLTVPTGGLAATLGRKAFGLGAKTAMKGLPTIGRMLARPGVGTAMRTLPSAGVSAVTGGLSALGDPDATGSDVARQAALSGITGGLISGVAARSGQKAIQAGEESAARQSATAANKARALEQESRAALNQARTAALNKPKGTPINPLLALASRERSPEGAAMVQRMKGKLPVSGEDVAQAVGGEGVSQASPSGGTPIAPQLSKLGEPGLTRNPLMADAELVDNPLMSPLSGGTPISPKLAKLGKGKTLPYYPKGGEAEQAVAPLPSASSLTSGTPNITQLEKYPRDFLEKFAKDPTNIRVRPRHVRAIEAFLNTDQSP